MKTILDNVLQKLNATWEILHLNAKYSKANVSLQLSANQTSYVDNSVPYANYPCLKLPEIHNDSDITLMNAIHSRRSHLKMRKTNLSLENIAALFLQSYSFGNNHHFTTPSAGALYPIEIFFHYSPLINRNNNFGSGLYYYNPKRKELRYLIEINCDEKIKDIFMQKNIARNSSLQIFITSVFSRSTKKYGDRGYIYSLLEAGHVAQNINLVAGAMGLNSINIGGYYNKESDQLLGIDGLSHSTVYMIAVGSKA